MLGKNAYVGTVTTSYGAPPSTDVATSMGGVEPILPQTPSSVTKPTGPSDAKGQPTSSVTRALLDEFSADEGLADILQTPTCIQTEEVGMPVPDAQGASSPPSTAEASEKSLTRRRQEKNQLGSASKKQKP